MLLALDRSARTFDVDGHLKVRCLLSRACVNDYRGDEVPDAERLGLDPSRIYRVWRDPAALEAATPGLEGKPVLLRHQPIDAENHPHEIVVGTIGNPTFENGSVFGDLIVWDADSIRLIESGEQRELSLGYRYRAIPESGTTPEGEAYDLRMADIAMNHCALVTRARVLGAMVADSANELAWHRLGAALDAFMQTSKKEETKQVLNSKKGRAFVARFKALCAGEGMRADNDPRDIPDEFEMDAKRCAALDSIIPNAARVGRGDAVMMIGADGSPQNMPRRCRVSPSARQVADFNRMFPALERVR
jgi:hypothetical protein